MMIKSSELEEIESGEMELRNIESGLSDALAVVMSDIDERVRTRRSLDRKGIRIKRAIGDDYDNYRRQAELGRSNSIPLKKPVGYRHRSDGVGSVIWVELKDYFVMRYGYRERRGDNGK